jgi:hypothetical protein
MLQIFFKLRGFDSKEYTFEFNKTDKKKGIDLKEEITTRELNNVIDIHTGIHYKKNNRLNKLSDVVDLNTLAADIFIERENDYVLLFPIAFIAARTYNITN